MIIAVIALGAYLSSCNKDKDTLPQQSEMTTESTTTTLPTSSDVNVDDATFNNTSSNQRAGNTWIMNANSANDIPTQMFGVDPKYKISYQHKKMNYINGFGKCSWTSYVIAASCIIRGNYSWYSYPVNDTKVDQVMNACKNRQGSYANGALITALQWYCNTNDNFKLSCFQKSTANSSSGRFLAIKYMLDHIYTEHSPFLVISSSGNCGHYLVVHSIDWKKGGTGSMVYYTDCLYMGSNTSISANLKSMDLSSFLNKMVVATSYYNMLFLWPTGF